MIADYMAHSGDDILVVNAARVSFSKESEMRSVYSAEDTAPDITDSNALKVEEFLSYLARLEDEQDVEFYEDMAVGYSDYNLIQFLARERHMLPFRHPHVTLRCKAPMFVVRQLGKHQVGMTWSEESRRYVDYTPELWTPEYLRKRSESAKQGSTDEPVASVRTLMKIAEAALDGYEDLLAMGVAPEQARMVLPQNMMVNWVWTGSLLSWFHLYDQRTGHGAQKEVTMFAELVDQQMGKLYPASWEALKKYCRNYKED